MEETKPLFKRKFIRGHAHDFVKGDDTIMLSVDADKIHARIKDIIAQVDSGKLNPHTAKSILLNEISLQLRVIPKPAKVFK